MNPKMKNDLDDLCTFVLESSNESDYLVRFNFLLSIFIFDFEQKLKNNNKLPYFLSTLIDDYNNALNKIVIKLNKTKTFENISWKPNVFYTIIKYQFEAEYSIWKYSKECLLN